MNSGAWKNWITALKKNTYALHLALRDSRVPIAAKVIIGLVVAYALSPIDLIPDFIPVIGYLDDLVILPLGIWLAIRLTPRAVWRECQELAAEQEQLSELPNSQRAAVVIMFIWLLSIVGFMLWLWPLLVV